MYLKSIEAVGFKSFAEKIKLDFGRGISVIVGPNGCGKSNVSDAIKWVLGEQSAKSLRTPQMTDVIFNGTENRRPALGMAEVTLVFDNLDGALPIDFTEVSVARKIYRSGEGEYFINKSPCRLKDIRDLFAGTGIGADGYSIVEQRKVEFIIDSKPEQRRELIDEAAGISKYKFRKEEALRKLERVRQDLNRINDMLVLHQEQVKSLESAARKARQHQKLKDELRRAELANVIRYVDENRAKIEEQKSLLAPLLEKRERNVSGHAGLQAETEKIKSELAETDKEITARQEEIYKLNSRLELADTRISQADELARSCEERIKQRLDDIARCEESSGRLSEEESVLSREMETLAAAASSVRERFDEASRAHEELALRISGFDGEEKSIRDKLMAQYPALSEKGNAKSRLESDLAHLEDKISATRKELDDTVATHEASRAMLEAKNREREEFVAESAALDGKLSDAGLRASAAAASLGEFEKRRAELSQTVSVLEGEISAMKLFEESDPALMAAKALISAGVRHGELRGPVTEMFDIAPDRRAEVLAALGEKALFMAARNRSAALDAVRYLSSENLYGLTFVVEDEVPPAPPCDANLLAAVSARDAADEKIIRYLLSGLRLEDGAVSAGALVRGISSFAVSAASAVVARKAKEETLSLERTGLETIVSGIAEKSAEAGRAEAERNSLVVEIKTRAARLEGISEKISEISKLVSEREDFINTLRGEISLAAADAENSLTRVAALDADIAALRENESALKSSLESARARKEEIAPAAEERRKKFEAVRAELFGVEPKIDALKSKLESLAEQKRYLASSAAQSAKEIETWRAEISNHEKVKASELETLGNSRAQKESMETGLSEIFRKKEGVTARLDALENDMRAFSDEKDAVNEQIHALEMEIRTLTVGAESALSRLREEYETDEQSARGLIAESLLDAEEMAKLRRRIESLGSVNLAAPEEYDALNKKYEFILSQKNDLDKAKSDLEEIISKINKTTKEQLTVTFARVRENFQSVFTKLFEGGQGDLVLTDPDNILESGVEIIARPPGKTTKSISLSGGEKALTAVALLFSFYLVRPAPFCLLDEADAPLDEANVERFLNLLETFTDRSQFLIITHNKRTMLRGDVIYGITMEEFGVSKAISMKFERVEGTAVPA